LVKEIADKSPDGEAGASDPMLGMSATQLRATQDSLPVFLEAMWHVSVLDIERTVTAVTHKLCRDHSVSEQERSKRAEALAVMGHIFMEAAKSKGGSKDPKEKVAEMVAIMVPAAAAGTSVPPAAAGAPAGGAPAAAGTGGGTAAGAAAERAAPSPPLSVEELRKLKPSELKRRMRERGVSGESVVEKEELVQLLSAAYKA
jgi:hypothetical protein